MANSKKKTGSNTKYGTHYSSGAKAYRRRKTMPDGSVRNVYAQTKTELDEKWNALLAEAEAIKKGGAMRAKSPTVAAYAEKQLMFLKESVSYGTYIGYESKVKKYIINKFAPDKLMCDVTRDDVEEATLEVKKLSKSTCDTVHWLYLRIFRRAHEAGIIERDPTVGFTLESQKLFEQRPSLSDEEVKILLAAVKGLSVEPFIRIALETGMRREEVLGLQWDAVLLDVERPYIQVKRAWRIVNNRPVVSEKLKTKAAKRTIPISASFAEYLRDIKANSSPESAYVIANSDGEALSGSQWQNLWEQVTRRMTKPHNYVRYVDGKKQIHTVTPELGKAAKHNPEVVYSIPFHFTSHQLRHTAITNWVYRGYDVKTVQKLAGHSNIKETLDIYAECKCKTPEEMSKEMFGENWNRIPFAI